MPGRSLNHAKRSPGTVQSNRIAVLDNGKLDRDWFDDCSSHQPQSCGRGLEYRNRRGAMELVLRHLTGQVVCSLLGTGLLYPVTVTG
jgi:hypothetical protein